MQAECHCLHGRAQFFTKSCAFTIEENSSEINKDKCFTANEAASCSIEDMNSEANILILR